jgi:hypothetical protein
MKIEDLLYSKVNHVKSLLTVVQQLVLTLSGRVLPFGNIEPIFPEEFNFSDDL